MGCLTPYIVKRAIAAELESLGRPVAAEELQKVCPEGTTQEAIEYHICTLGLVRVLRPVPRGKELLFQFVGDPDGRWCRHLGLRGGVRRPQ